MDNSDDQWRVTSPAGEKVGQDGAENGMRCGWPYFHGLSAGGGPDEYLVRRAIRGEYVIQASYDNTAAPPGPVTVQAEVFTSFGRDTEQHRSLVVRLKEKTDPVTLGRVRF